MYELCVVRIPETVRVSFERLYDHSAFWVIEVTGLQRSFAVRRDGPRCTAGSGTE